MIQYRFPIRIHQLIPLTYTFQDQDKHTIDLSPFTGGFFLELKPEGGTLVTQAAALVGPASNGKVTSSYEFTILGLWNYQFYATDGSGKPLWGEPIQIRVVENLEDLTTKLAAY